MFLYIFRQTNICLQSTHKATFCHCDGGKLCTVRGQSAKKIQAIAVEDQSDLYIWKIDNAWLSHSF